MATQEEIDKIVLDYAAASDIFSTPTRLSEPISPSPKTLAQGHQKKFFDTFRKALGNGGVNAKIPFNGLMDCTTWTQVSLLAFQDQE